MVIRFSTKLLILFMAFSCSLLYRCLGNDIAEKERTLAIIKPDGLLGNYTDDIKRVILQSGFVIADEMETQLHEDIVKSFYSEHASKSFFPHLVDYMTSGPVVIMILEKLNAVADWRALIGPTDAAKAKVTHPQSIRAMCGMDLQRNCVHGSDSLLSATKEISILFKKISPEVPVLHDEL
ncbi:probable nucleoside diphosphate kinase 5 [Impatiens glandulifera]|uniref:probable nucleoside diphosphate kinase 5 n=1 Tax=Impatiens glandulifera TaxID=253017 RepID=UPI001FB0F74B|nr:probable nucleoside diphosphate kinase 5 [Impatiens glandulifera]